MISFFVLNGENKRECQASDAGKAASILNLMFPVHKGYVVENGKIAFAQNLTIEEAQSLTGIQPIQTMEVLPKPKKTVVKSKVKVKPKKKAKKTTVKTKVKVKAKPKKKAKKKVKK